nr:restriction endonuclease subunit S [Portibacter marinus]
MKTQNWNIHLVDDVADEKSIRVDNPSMSEYDKFVGLEHFTSGDFVIKNYGSTEDLKSGMKYFSDGDLLFARRNAYLKRASNVNFEGVCSGDAIVITRKNERIIPRFLTLIFNTSCFWDYAISNAAGTMSKRVKWRDLKEYQFKLPPKDEQESILNLFLTLETQIEQTEAQEENLRGLKRQLLRDLFSEKFEFGNHLSKDDFEEKTFDEVADQISKRIDPGKTELEIYVGLEHLDPDNLTIKRTGVPADVKGTKLLIWKEDIIFGKRRAYQRKVAVSHFDGICSAHSMVLRAKEYVIEKDFLPFFMQSDAFMNRAIQISEGSLSPTIKWKVLKTQRFFFPKKEKQQGLITLFKSFDTNIELLNSQTQTLKQLKQKLLDEILG